MERLIPPASIPMKTLRIVEPQYHPHYTLDDIRALAAQYADERHCEAKLAVQLALSCFCEWIQRREAKREQGKETDALR